MKSKIVLVILVALVASAIGYCLVTSKANKDSLKFGEGYEDGCADVKSRAKKKTFYVKQEGPYVLGYNAGYENCLSFKR